MLGSFLTPLSIFQVLRILRLVKASPMLEDFVYKIFGPGIYSFSAESRILLMEHKNPPPLFLIFVYFLFLCLF